MRPSNFLVFLLLLFAATYADSATVLQRELQIQLGPQGSVEDQLLQVRLEERGDLDAWNSYSIYVDEHIRLKAAEIEVIGAKGVTKNLAKIRDFRRETSVGGGLHSSAARLTADLTGLNLGDILKIETSVVNTPPYKAGWESLLMDSPQKHLSIRISGAPETLRWQLRAADELVEVQESQGEINIEGHDLPRLDPPDRAGNVLSAGPAVLWAWDAARSWSEIGTWYRDLTRSSSPPGEIVSRKAAELSKGVQTSRGKLLAFAKYVSKSVRYEAVEVGVGGWIPSPAGEVIQRGWGDCKDKSEALRALLETAGISSHLVLVHDGFSGWTDPGFPSTLGFNHCILAVEAEQIETEATDPVTEGFFFLDPTMDLGPVGWFNPYNQGQWALISKEPGRLVKLPTRYQEEGRVLTVDGVVDSSRAFQGIAVLELVGSRALPWLRSLTREAPERIEEDLRQYFQVLMPGMTLGKIAWNKEDKRVPAIRFVVRFTESKFLRKGRSLRMRMTFLRTLPAPRDVEDRKEPVVLMPGIQLSQWRIRLPEGMCRPKIQASSFSNSIGSVEKYPGDDKGVFTLTHKVVVHRSWIGAESLEQLKEIAIAENSADRAVLRWSCPE